MHGDANPWKGPDERKSKWDDYGREEELEARLPIWR
jgi:hypothetical protein